MRPAGDGDVYRGAAPNSRGSTSTGRTRKIMVRQKDRIAEVLPSLRAVSQPEENVLYASIKKLIATI